MRHLLQVDEGKAGLDHGRRVWKRFGRPIGRNTVFLWMLVPVFVLLGLRIYVPVLQGIVLAFRQYNMLNLSNTGFNGLVPPCRGCGFAGRPPPRPPAPMERRAPQLISRRRSDYA